MRFERQQQNKLENNKYYHAFLHLHMLINFHSQQIIYFHRVEQLYALTQYLLNQAFNLHEVTCQISMEDEPNSGHYSKEQNQAISFIKHLNLEGETTDIKPNNDTEEQEKVLAMQSREILDIENDRKLIQEEAKETEEETEILLAETAPESTFSNLTPFYSVVFILTVETIYGNFSLKKFEVLYISKSEQSMLC